MTVLAFDLTTAQGSIALARDSQLLEEFPLSAPGGYGEIIFAALDSLLQRHSLALGDVGLFAVAVGPGTFTGVRIGLALVQGFAEALKKPVAGVSNLRALAYSGSGNVRYPVLDARRGEYYTAIYSAEGDLLEPEKLQTLSNFGYEPLHQNGPLAAAIAAIALTCPPLDPAALEPNYIRKSDAELNLILRPLSSRRM